MVIKNLKNSREERDLKETDIAQILGLDRTTICKYESGADKMPLERLIEYANKLEFSLDYLFGLQDENNFKPIKIDKDEIANNLKTLRKMNKVTQVEITNKLGQYQSTYSHYEKAIRLPSSDCIQILVKLYKPFSIDKDIFNVK